VLVGVWIAFNIWGPLAFRSLPVHPAQPGLQHQAAYAAPLILLAQTRQADRDKALSEADAQHREALATASLERQEIATRQQEQILTLLEQNTELTRISQELTLRVEELTRKIHSRLCVDEPSHPFG
jgi:uncharacterized membrane protein